MIFFKNSMLMLTLVAIAPIVELPISATTAIATLDRLHKEPDLWQRGEAVPPKVDNVDLIAKSSQAKFMQLPDTGAQNDSWSCGPNSAARLLRYYGHQVDYPMVRAVTDKKLFLPQRLRNPLTNKWIEVRTGTPPKTLQQVMQRWEGDRVKQSPRTNFNKLINLVQSGKPAIALVRVGGLSLPYVGSIPYLHWIAVTGVDTQRQRIYYTDTNSQTYSMSYQDFQAEWNLGLDKDVSVAIANVLKNNGVEPRTIVWIDRT
ncbi:MAG: hypothetical protein DCE90_10855 [Pseudanabaena sp.]|nr:MAG: hypothetical protein DCE90_10855 [Pseudanabaena sp.]